MSYLQNWSQEFRKWLGPERIHVFVVAGENKIQVMSGKTANL